jgi:ethanolamine utilization protein EutQ (cupin superfamily)
MAVPVLPPDGAPAGAWLVPADPGAGAEAAPGVRMSLPFDAAGATRLGGGHLRFEADADLGAWRLTYDELLHVLCGRMTVESLDPPGEPLVLEAGASALLAAGATVRYTGTAGTHGLFVMTPRGARPVAVDT